MGELKEQSLCSLAECTIKGQGEVGLAKGCEASFSTI